MGNQRGRRLGIFGDEEVKDLSNHDHRKLEEYVLEQLCKSLKGSPLQGEVKKNSKDFLDGLTKK
jgi:hypothetical protein